MTISTYTEPQPVTTVNELPQAHETEEDAEPGEFEKLLAGLLNRSGMEVSAESGMPAGISGDDVDVLSGELSNTEIGLLGIGPEAADVPKENLLETGDHDLSEEQLNIFFTAEHLLTRSNGQLPATDDNGEIPQELSNVEMAAYLTDIEQGADFSSLATASTAMLDTEEDAAVAAMLAQNAAAEFAEAGLTAAQDVEKSLLAEAGKKDRALRKDENIDAPSAASRSGELASLRKEPEKEGRSRLDEARSRSRRDRVTFEVRDLRTGGAEGLKNAETRLNAAAETRTQGSTPVREITLELRLPGQDLQNPSRAQTSWETQSGNALENMLARELHQNFNNDIVRHASMALRDGGEGTIRLALKPESLGNVKIHLEMTENKITGRIVVESEEALNAFRKEISSLEQAFRDSGFANADLNLSLTADGRNTEWQEQEARHFTPQIAASRYDDSSRGSAEQDMFLVDVFFGRRPGSINMLA